MGISTISKIQKDTERYNIEQKNPRRK